MTRWMTLKAAADHAGVSVPTVRRAIEAGRITGYRISCAKPSAKFPGGRLVRVRQQDVDAWISGGKKEAA